MKSITLKTLVLLSFLLLNITNLFSQENITKKQWQEDLRYLQETVHTTYPFLFKKIEKTEWDAEVEKLYQQIPSLETHEIKVGLMRMVSLFEYGHTQIPFGTLAKEAVLPVNLYHFKDGIFIEGVQKENQQLLGAKLIEIGGMPITEVIAAVRPVVPVENDNYFKAYGLSYITVPSILHAQGVIPEYSKDVTVTLEKNGKEFQHTFSSVPLEALSRAYGFTIPTDTWRSVRKQSKTPLFLKHLNEKLFFFEYLEASKTMYVRQSSVFNDEKETLKDFYKRLFAAIDTNNVEKLIYDVRLNGGGNNYNNKDLIKGLMERPKINKEGSFFYIIGRNTFSACQNLTNEIENYTEAIIVGEPTAENKNFYGDNRQVILPNSKIMAYISFAWWQDMPQWENKDWTEPHIAVSMTLNEYVNNEDPVLKAALNYTDTGFILDPEKHLTELFIQGKMEQFEKDGLKIAQDPAYTYSNFEEGFAKAGYRLFAQGNIEGGIYIMQFITKAYPASQEAWYNLASAQQEIKQFEKAKENYKKAITLEPNSILAKTSEKRLVKLAQ